MRSNVSISFGLSANFQFTNTDMYFNGTYVNFQSTCLYIFSPTLILKLGVCDKLINSRSLSAAGDHYKAADKSLLMAFALLHIYDLHISLACLRRDQREIKVLFLYPLTDYGNKGMPIPRHCK